MGWSGWGRLAVGASVYMRQVYEYHPVIGFRFIPGLKARLPHEGGGYLIRTNETGFRCGHSFRKEKRPSTRRVLLFGDSFTAGEGVSDGQRYSEYLEEMVPNLEVYNLGLPATGTDQHYLIYREYARDIEHDSLVIAVFVDNVRRVGSRYRYFLDESGRRVLYAKPYFVIENGALILRGVPPQKRPIHEDDLSPEERRNIFATARFPRMRTVLERLRQFRYFEDVVISSGLMERLQRMTRYQPITEYEDPDHVSWQIMRAIIRAWISEHDRPVMLMPIPLYHYVAGLSNARSYRARLQEATISAGGTFYDPLPELMRFSLEDRRSFYFARDGHLTRAGHRALAGCMAAGIRRILGAGD